MIDSDVIAGEDTTIEAGVQLLGKTKIGERCVIKDWQRSEGHAAGGWTSVVEPYCVLTESRLDCRCDCRDPFARLRPLNHLKRGGAHREFRGVEEECCGGRDQGNASELPGRCKNWGQVQYWSRHDYMQLRRISQISDNHRQQSVCG